MNLTCSRLDPHLTDLAMCVVMCWYVPVVEEEEEEDKSFFLGVYLESYTREARYLTRWGQHGGGEEESNLITLMDGGYSGGVQ